MSPAVFEERMTQGRLMLPREGRRLQLSDEPQDIVEERSWDRDFGHLEGDIATMTDALRADLDQLFLRALQRPVLDRLVPRGRRRPV